MHICIVQPGDPSSTDGPHLSTNAPVATVLIMETLCGMFCAKVRQEASDSTWEALCFAKRLQEFIQCMAMDAHKCFLF